ncbi:lysoplasmalogenase [Urechidicola vernalis]|uniref:Lysoplasmalogenase n=1 Tax=Urechidicola vernalis TaxID=3075600 RepID=A0ABU2Y6Y5_9FLAO|nr:lysoplasmalogenase [Urechidicola sp. P050]MDT0553968.1 lysoplasmalogenase [Urechidicola sp. P050]
MNKSYHSKVWLLLFTIISLLHLTGFIIENDALRHVTKPFILIFLGLYYWSSVVVKRKLYLIALFFSFLGDVLLISISELSFMLGLGAFLLSHLFYISLILRSIRKSSFSDKMMAAIPFVLLFSGLIYLLKDNLGGLLVPVVLYGLVISLFGTTALLNYNLEKSKPSKELLIGAILFIVSDSILAINKFFSASELMAISVMITYILAQYVICTSVINNLKERS